MLIKTRFRKRYTGFEEQGLRLPETQIQSFGYMVFHRQDVPQMLLNYTVAIHQLKGVGTVNLSVILRCMSSHSALVDYRS